MNHKSIDVSSIKDFDEASGCYRLKCICGAMTVISPNQLLQSKVNIQCRSCYLEYELHATGE